VSRQDNFGMDTIMKGLTSGNFSEAEIVELAKKCTRPHDQFYIDFQEPSEDMSSVIKAYEDESIVRLVSYNFKHWLQRMGVADKYLQNFESHVKVLAADYVDPELAYAKPVVHCVDLDAVDPDILKIMKGVGCSMPKHTVLCRSTRRDKEGFLEYLKGQGISARRSIQADPRDGSGMIHGCVFGAESE